MAHMPNEHVGKPRRRTPTWVWVLLGIGVFVVLSCGGCLTWIMYVGSIGPHTYVYAGNQVPAPFMETMRNVGALEDGENVRFFYSDALTDIRDGFYFVSDQRVVVYAQESVAPLISVPFDQIAEADLSRDMSLLVDSIITLSLTDGSPVAFPVSSESDGDQRFYDEIRKHIK